MPRKYRKIKVNQNESDNKTEVAYPVNAASSDKTEESVVISNPAETPKDESVNTPAKTEAAHEITEDTFRVKHSTNAVIDEELNRIWGYLKTSAEREKKMESLIKSIDSIAEDIKAFKDEIKAESKRNLEEVKSVVPQIDAKTIVHRVAKELFGSEEFMEKFSDEILKELRKSNKINLLYDGKDIKDARFEFGFAKKGSIVFFNKAFNQVLWHIPDEVTMVTNTGFVALRDAFWIVIGEDSE